MLDEFRQRLRDRRGKYSLRRHLGRLRREGRLRQIVLAAVGLLTVGGLAFGRCQGSSITGPSDPMAETPVRGTVTAGGSVTPSASLGSETFKENTVERNVVFSGVNPCNGDMVKAMGKRHDKIRIVASPTSFAVDHHINDSFHGEAIDDPLWTTRNSEGFHRLRGAALKHCRRSVTRHDPLTCARAASAGNSRLDLADSA